MKLLKVILKTGLFAYIASAMSANAAEGSILRMQCGAAGVVTARLRSQIADGEPYYYTDIYSSGLNVGAKNLAGYAGAYHFSLDDKGYKIIYMVEHNSGGEQFSFERYGKAYRCQELR